MKVRFLVSMVQPLAQYLVLRKPSRSDSAIGLCLLVAYDNQRKHKQSHCSPIMEKSRHHIWRQFHRLRVLCSPPSDGIPDDWNVACREKRKDCRDPRALRGIVNAISQPQVAAVQKDADER